jgi:hypothetical protein
MNALSIPAHSRVGGHEGWRPGSMSAAPRLVDQSGIPDLVNKPRDAGARVAQLISKSVRARRSTPAVRERKAPYTYTLTKIKSEVL